MSRRYGYISPAPQLDNRGSGAISGAAPGISKVIKAAAGHAYSRTASRTSNLDFSVAASLSFDNILTQGSSAQSCLRADNEDVHCAMVFADVQNSPNKVKIGSFYGLRTKEIVRFESQVAAFDCFRVSGCPVLAKKCSGKIYKD